MTTTTTLPTPSGTADDSPPPDRPANPLARYIRHSFVLARRSLTKTFRNPESLVDVTIQPLIFLTMFTYIFGGAISGGSQSHYLQFLLPGILAQTIVMSGVSLGSNLNTDIEKGVFDRFRSLPIGRSVPLVGGVLADAMRYLILLVVTLGAGMIMGFRFDASIGAAVAGCALVIAFALCFVWIAVFIGMKARTSGAVTGITFLIVMPISFASNVFVPTKTMPDWLAAFAKVNPMSHLVGALRGLFGGGAWGVDVVWTLGWMAVLLLVFVPLALRAYRKRL